MTEPKRYLTPAQQRDVLSGVEAAEQWRANQERPTPNGAKPLNTEPPLRLYTPSELLEWPEPEWLVEPFIVNGTLSILFGASGSFKSFLAIDWAGRAPGLAVYISAEGSPRRLGERIAAWEHTAQKPANILTLPHALNLIHDTPKLLRTIDMIVSPISLLVVDTAARNMAGHDENSTKDMGELVASLDQIRHEHQCSVLVIHHSGHDNTDRERGSSALRGAADISIHAKRGEAPLEVKLRCAKTRDTAEFEPSIVRLIPTNDTLVAARAQTAAESLEEPVLAYLKANPNASQREAEAHIVGRSADIRTAYHKIKHLGTHLNPHG